MPRRLDDPHRVSPTDREDPLADLRDRGLVRDPIRPRSRSTSRTRLQAFGSVSDLVSEQRH